MPAKRPPASLTAATGTGLSAPASILIGTWGRKGSTEPDRSRVASRGAVGLVKSGKKVTADNNFAYAA